MKESEIPQFEAVSKRMDHFFQLIQLIDRKQISALKKIRGIYIFYEGGKAIYVGRTNDLGQRLLQHSQASSSHFSANFAFKIAKEEWKAKNPNTKIPKREELEKLSDFDFNGAKARVANMEIFYVPIDNSYEQYLFEFWAALHFKTKYNHFENH